MVWNFDFIGGALLFSFFLPHFSEVFVIEIL